MKEDLRKTFTANLAHYMNEKGVDQSEIVRRLGVPASTVSDWYLGKAFPRPDKIEQLADLLNVLYTDLTEEPGRRGEASMKLSEEERDFVLMLRKVPAEQRGLARAMIEAAIKRN